MSTIAQGMITLSSVNDAFSVSLSPNSCVINADYNGKNPKLAYAYTDIKVVRGEVPVAFEEPTVVSKPNDATLTISKVDNTTWRATIDSIPETELNGSFQLSIKAGSDFSTEVAFTYTVVRETSMLDWILDWNTTYTEISGQWIITPKIFAGSKDSQNKITGVYIGPAFDDNANNGIYGYKNDELIFQINQNGGVIGGWVFAEDGLQTSDVCLKILAEGAIIAAPEGQVAWSLNKDGSATFASGNVHFYADGSADFSGKITSSSGKIGGWHIGQHSIYNNAVIIDSASQFIGLRKVGALMEFEEPSSDTFYNDLKINGGIAIFSKSCNFYGMECWLNGALSFSLGSTNKIAGWNFDYDALSIGEKNNMAKQYSGAMGAITIGTSGLRGMNWYIDNDGEVDFVDGLLHFNEDGGEISGWQLNAHRFAAKHAALISQDSFCGLYLSMGDMSTCADSAVHNIVASKGGIEIVANDTESYIKGWETNGSSSFFISSLPGTLNYIGGWNFDGDAIFKGTKQTTNGQYASANSITLGPSGLRGFTWRFELDGSGALAKGKITWTSQGDVTLSDSSLKILDSNNNVTSLFDSNGRISASFIDVRSIECRNPSDNQLMSGVNREGDGAFCIYYPSGQVMMRYGYKRSVDGIESVAQHYKEDGTEDWIISPIGSMTSVNWETVDYWSTENYTASPSYYKGTPTSLYSLSAIGTGTLFYFSEPQTSKPFSGEVWTLLCDPEVDEDGRKAAYRTKRVIENGVEVSVSKVFMGYPPENFNWEEGE